MPESRPVILCLLFVLAFQGSVFANGDPIASPDSLYRIRSQYSGIEKAEINLEIARYYFNRNLDSLTYYISILEGVLNDSYDTRIDAFTKKFKGFIAASSLDIESSIKFSRESFELFEKLKDYREMGWINISVGTNYIRLGDYASATEQYLKALANFELVDHKRGIGDAYNGLGRIYYATEHFVQAKEYFTSALRIFDEIGLDDQKNKVYNNLGIMLLDNDEYRAALSNFRMAANGFSKIGDTRRLALVYGNIAIVYDELKMNDSAMFFCRKAYNYSKDTGDEYGIISGLINLGYFQRLNQEYDSSLICFNRALELSKKNSLKSYEEVIYKEFADYYADLNDFRKAYSFHLMRDSIHSLIRDENSQKRIEELMFSYNQRLKEKELNQLRTDQEMQTKLNALFLLLIALIFASLIILSIVYRKNVNQKRLLEENYKLLNETNHNLERSESTLHQLIENKNRLFSLIAHDLRNPISAVSGFSELLSQNYDNIDDDSRKEYIEQILQASLRTLGLLENLLHWAKSQMNLIEIKKTTILASSLIDLTVDPLMSSLEQKGILLEKEIENDFEIEVDPEMIKAVLRNLLSNAIKFSYSGSKIRIITHEGDKKHCISVSDEGTGIEPSQLGNLFSPTRISVEGTRKESGSGLGLIISKDFTERNGGEIEVESEFGVGSTFTICFPNNT